MRAVLALALVACVRASSAPPTDGFTAPECFPDRTSECHYLAIGDGVVLFDWTCTTGVAHPEQGRPDHRPCVVCSPAKPRWCETGAGACVEDCSVCTPSLALKVDWSARCTPRDETWPPSWAPGDMAGGAIGGL